MSLFNDLPRHVSIERQIECVERELVMRRRVYPRFVESGRMTKAQADSEINVMIAVRATLEAAKERA